MDYPPQLPGIPNLQDPQLIALVNSIVHSKLKETEIVMPPKSRRGRGLSRNGRKRLQHMKHLFFKRSDLWQRNSLWRNCIRSKFTSDVTQIGSQLTSFAGVQNSLTTTSPWRIAVQYRLYHNFQLHWRSLRKNDVGKGNLKLSWCQSLPQLVIFILGMALQRVRLFRCLIPLVQLQVKISPERSRRRMPTRRINVRASSTAC